jgi:hypothetical protein
MSCDDTYYLNENTTLTSSDLLKIFNTANGVDRKVSVNTLLTYLQTALSFGNFVPQFTTQYSAPSATGFTTTITNSSASIRLILTPLAGYATGTLTLPINTIAIDKQVILVNCTQAVTTLTINGNGATVTGTPTTLTANAFFQIMYDKLLNTWYRIG